MHNGRFDSLRNITRQRVSSYKLAYLLVAGLIVIVELAFHTLSDALAAPAVLVLALLGVTLAVAPWIGIAGDVLYIAAFVAADFSGYTESLSFPVIGVFLIAVIWVIEHHALRAILVLVGTATLGIALSEKSVTRLASEAVLAVIVLGIGFILRAYSDRAAISARELAAERQASCEAVASVRGELAVQLHDTIAKDLARVAISAQNLAIAHPELAREIDPLTTIAQKASRRLRPMIMDLNLTVARSSLRASVKESTIMLCSRNITLSVEMVADIDQLLSRQAMLTASLFVREAATNVLKYGQAFTSAELYVDLAESELALMMSNQIATVPVDHALTGGFGLANLQSRIESEGGRLSFVSTGTQWMINATIPNHVTASIAGHNDGENNNGRDDE